MTAELAAALLLATAVWLLVREPGSLTRVGFAVPKAPRRRLLDLRLGSRARRHRAQQRSAAIAALGALAAELRAGQPTGVALERAGAGHWPQAVAASRLGGDIGVALGDDAKRIPTLQGLAACWTVAAEAGSGLADAVTRLADAARVDEDVRVQLEAQLAGPRATARMLGLLPVIGLLIGSSLGADPVTWLTQSPAGLLCLAAGIGFTALGMAWTGSIARNVERLL
jgi:tight adherence protein B